MPKAYHLDLACPRCGTGLVRYRHGYIDWKVCLTCKAHARYPVRSDVLAHDPLQTKLYDHIRAVLQAQPRAHPAV